MKEDWFVYLNDGLESNKVASGSSHDEVLAKMRQHPRWDEQKFAKKAPSEFEGSVETYWEKASARSYPIFDVVHKI